MPAVSNRSKAVTRRSTWDRFGESLQIGNHIIDKAGVLPMPDRDIYFELLLDASIREDMQLRNFEAVMRNDRSSDLAIAAANDAKLEAGHALRTAWREFKAHGSRDLEIAALQGA